MQQPAITRAVKFSENACHCEESATEQSHDTAEIASQSLAMTRACSQNITVLPSITIHNLRAAYWRKAELMEFCRRQGLPTTGSKQELLARIEKFLTTGQIAPPEASHVSKRASGKMPEQLTRDTLIEPHFRCSQGLRAFFEAELGPQFHFHGVMRDFIKQGAGKTLQDAIDAWNQDQQMPTTESEIAPQFEYNRHIREFFRANPGAALPEAIAAWKEKKARRNESIQERIPEEKGGAK